MKKSNDYSDGDDLGPMLCCEIWLLDSKSDSVIFFLVPGLAALPATQIAEWYVHKDICNKTMRFEGADFLRVVESRIGHGWRSAS